MRLQVWAALRLQERVAVAVADAVITVNEALRDRLTGLGVAPGKVTVILNTPDLALRTHRDIAGARRPIHVADRYAVGPLLKVE